MKEGFYSLTVAKKVQETADAVTVYLNIPEELKEQFMYTPGQYLTFEVEINGESVRRSYSLCTVYELDALPAVTIKKVDNGKMSNYMNTHLQEGQSIAVMPPMGKFTVVPNPEANEHYVLFAGGSGITPMMGIAKAVLQQEPNSKITLIYANRNSDSVIFKQQWTELEKSSNGRLKIFFSYDQASLTWFGLKGYLTPEKVSTILQTKITGNFLDCQYYICGPSPMMDIVKGGLQNNGVDINKIHTEYFAAPVSDKKETVEATINTAFSGNATVTLTVYKKTHTIVCDKDTPILNAAMKNGIDPPYSCTVGVCTTCRAKVIKGEVQMLEREGLSDAEIAQGYILTCQSVPRSNEIIINYE